MNIMLIECMHCQCHLGIKDGLGVVGITSGLCKACVKKYYPAYADELLRGMA